jgi:hypothetical protein
VAEPTFKNLRELDQNFFQGQFSIISNFQPNFLLDTTPLKGLSSHFKGIVGAVVIFDHGLKFGIIFLVSDHPAHEKLIAIKKKFITIE